MRSNSRGGSAKREVWKNALENHEFAYEAVEGLEAQR